MMQGQNRETGVAVIGDLPWGTHLCLFYHTKEDLLDILVPYFRAGLENHEYCMWVTSEPLSAEEAARSLGRAVGGLDEYIGKGQIEILEYSEWYTRQGRFEADEVLQGWVARENEAVRKGFDGLRLTGNTFWLGKEDWGAFADYEAAVDRVIGQYRMLALCTYSLDRCGASEIMDVVGNHQFALIRRGGEWQRIESARSARAQEAVRESEQRYRQLFEGLGDAVVVYGSQGRFLDCNEGAVERYGYSREELLRLGLGDIVHPDFHRLMRGYQERIWAGEPIVSEVAHRRKNGTVIPVEINARRIAYQGEWAMLGVARDITERKRAEEALQHLNRQLAALLETAASLETSAAPGELATRLTQALADRLGYPFVGMWLLEGGVLKLVAAVGYADPFSTEFAEISLEQGIIGRVARSGQSAYVPDVSQDPDYRGLSDIRSEICCPLRDTSGVMGVLDVESYRTLTEGDFALVQAAARVAEAGLIRAQLHEHVQRQAAELAERLAERERAERLLHVLNQAALAAERALTHEEIFSALAEQFRSIGFSCAVYLTDESRKKLLPKYFSYEREKIRAAERLVGLRTEEFPAIPIEAVDTYRRVVWERKTAFVEDAEEPLRQLLPGLLKRFAGPIARMLKVSKSVVAPLIVEDEVIGALSVQSGELTEGDVPAITAFAHQMAAAWRKANLLLDLRNSLEALRQTQAQLLQAQKMEAVGRLAGGVAHDFNNLLTAIMGFGQLVLSELPAEDPQRADIEEILKAGERASSLTRQLLAFSRRQTLDMRVLDLNGLVTDTEKMLRRLIGEDVQLIIMLHPKVQRVRGDAAQMEQVIMNLVVNARDAMPEGGRLTIRTEDVTLDKQRSARMPQARPGRFVCLSIADTGVGMEEETLGHLFEPFFTTKGPEGTGLGLSVVYGIVAQHEGWIEVWSELGRGSTFKVYLPGLSGGGEGESREVVSLPKADGHGEGILLVEDDEGVRRAGIRMLAEGGYVVFQASSVKEALEVFGREGGKVDLLFTDVVLPDGSGLQLVEQLRSRRGDVRVLLGSGYADDRSQWSVVVNRGFRFVQKPYDWRELLRTVKEVMESGGGGQPEGTRTRG